MVICALFSQRAEGSTLQVLLGKMLLALLRFQPSLFPHSRSLVVWLLSVVCVGAFFQFHFLFRPPRLWRINLPKLTVNLAASWLLRTEHWSMDKMTKVASVIFELSETHRSSRPAKWMRNIESRQRLNFDTNFLARGKTSKPSKSTTSVKTSCGVKWREWNHF